MYKVILILDKFFLKHEWGGGSNWSPSPRKNYPQKVQLCCSLTRLISFGINWNLLTRVLKNIYFHHPVIFFFQSTRFSFYRTTKDFLAFIKPTVDVFAISFTCVPYNIDWWDNFWRWTNLIGLFEFHIALFQTLLKAFVNYIYQLF